MQVNFASTLKEIKNIEEYPKLGTGTDGSVYHYQDLALKILKFSNEERIQKGRMDFEKASYFIQEICTEKITFPKDILLDQNGVYCGIAMPYIEQPKNWNLQDFPVEYLTMFIEGLILDFEQSLTPKKVVPKDINFGSICCTSDLFQFCDTDKYKYMKNQDSSNVKRFNQDAVYYMLAKSFYFMIFCTNTLEREEKKKWQKWIKLQVKEKILERKIAQELKENHFENLSEYAEFKRKKVID